MSARPSMLEYLPQYYCPRCDDAIPGECVEGKMTAEGKGKHGGAGRIIRVYCDHCHALFQARFQYEGDRLVLDGQPAEVADNRDRDLFARRLAHTRGDVLLAC